MKVETSKFVTNIDEGISGNILEYVSNISIKNAEITYGIDYDAGHDSHSFKNLFPICDDATCCDKIEPEYVDVKTGFLIQVSNEGSDDTWSKSSITIFPIEEGDIKREKPVARFEQAVGFENIFHVDVEELSPLSTWVYNIIRRSVMRYIVGEIDFSEVVKNQKIYPSILWDEMVTLFSIITEEERKELINGYIGPIRWCMVDIHFQIRLLANAEVMNNLHDYDEFKKKFKREDILATISDCNQKGYYELQIFLNHCVPQETEDDWRKRWEL